MSFPLLSGRSLLFLDYVRPTVTTQYVRFKYAVQGRAFLEQKLGIPPKPKKPLTTYFRYVTEVRASVAAKHPTLNVCEQTVLIAKMWNSLDAASKQNYFKAFANDTVAYRQKLVEYYGKITEDDKRKLQSKQMELKNEIEIKENMIKQRKKAIELDRPVRPLGGYIKFFTEATDRKPNETWKDFSQRKTSEWHSLSVSQKDAYKAPAEDLEKFKRAYTIWKGKMIISGNYNLCRIKKNRKFEDVISSKES
ncbi:transcription factor A, mitochondrial-like [Bradysia coprophila]|uniref:transcription factor A, mitochondrial-like n=1 Tax=Bradysia coprophila TaxID=38358 RepID=UPI00187D7E32|nr:transcription factor A, mitochondrial-like [Bradysia coprophila]